MNRVVSIQELLNSVDVWLPGLLAMSALGCVSGFFSSSETAFFCLTHEDLRRFRVGTSAQRLVASLLARPDRLLTAILFWNLLVNLAYFAVSVVVTQRLTATGHPVMAGVFAVGGVLGIIVLGEVLPKSVAVSFRTGLSAFVAFPLATAVRVLDPVLPTLSRVSRALRRTFWPHVKPEPHIDTDDLERAVEASPLSEGARQRERLVLQNVLALTDITVQEVMRPRGTYVSLPAPVALADLHRETPPAGYVMVQEPDSEEIASAIPLHRFTRLPREDLHLGAEDVVHVPWCANCAFTLQRLRERACGVASVVNEYGETIGIVTYEDLLDTVVVPEPSRARRLLQREPIVEVDEGAYHVDGLTTLRYLTQRLKLDVDVENEESVTVTGMLVDALEKWPVAGDECEWRALSLRVIEVGQRGRLRILVRRTTEDLAGASASAEEVGP